MSRIDRHFVRRSSAYRLRWAAVPLASALSVAVLAACGSSSPASKTPPVSISSTPAAEMATSSPAAKPVPATDGAMITISKFAFSTPASVSPGAMVMVMNRDGESHTVTADSGTAFDDKAPAGASSSFKAPMAPGTYPFHCTYHSNMHGVLVVK